MLRNFSCLRPLFGDPESSRRYNIELDPRSVGAMAVLRADLNKSLFFVVVMVSGIPYTSTVIFSFQSSIYLTSSQTPPWPTPIRSTLQVRQRRF